MVYSLQRSGFTQHHICVPVMGAGSQGWPGVFRVMNAKTQDFTVTVPVKPQQTISTIYSIASCFKENIL